jgi:cell division control protein 6
MEIKTFINGCIESNTGGCTYVSGPPGTGKSALVTEVVSEFQETENVRKAYVNCMSMKNSKDVYGMLLDTFYQDVEIMEGEQLTTLQGMFVPRKRSNILYLVTLDEIDHLVSLDLEFMYKLFEWALQKSSRLVLVGIANALDLTDRLLPRLKARNLKPQLLPFLPYTAPQIKAVVITRLKSLLPEAERDGDFVPFVHPAAIELCSRKIAGQTGDLRKALDIVRRAIELVETETIRKRQQMLSEEMPNSPSRTPLSENNNLSSPPARSPSKHAAAATLRDLTMQTAPRASIAHLNKITSSTLGNGTNQRLKTLNLQQKAALCALVALEKRNRLAASNVMLTPSKNANAAPTVKKLYDTYCMLCRQETVLHPLTSTEFRDVIGSLETLSLISAVDSKNGSFVGLTTPSKRGRKPGFGGGVGVGDEKRVASVIGEKELQQGVEGLGAPILLSILSGEGLE